MSATHGNSPNHQMLNASDLALRDHAESLVQTHQPFQSATSVDFHTLAINLGSTATCCEWCGRGGFQPYLTSTLAYCPSCVEIFQLKCPLRVPTFVEMCHSFEIMMTKTVDNQLGMKLSKTNIQKPIDSFSMVIVSSLHDFVGGIFGPAKAAGIRMNDILVEINGKNVSSMSLKQVKMIIEKSPRHITMIMMRSHHFWA